MRKDWRTRLATARYARAAFVTLLAVAAAGQALGQAVALDGAGPRGGHPAHLPAVLAAEYVLPLTLLALLATVPLAVYRPVMAAAGVTVGNAVALVSFGRVTIAGVVAELVAAYWLGLAGGLDGAEASRRLGRAAGLGATAGRYLAVALALPFAAIALAGPGRSAILLAAAVPVAAGAGIAVWSGRLAQTRTEAGAALADTLLAHTARGERARIARELHDVVAHHISMIAVLSETGRLTTPGLPEAGARRFLEIGDTARAGLTEMRRLLGVLREDAESAAPAADAAGPARSAAAAAAATAAERASRQPQPGLTQLAELVQSARDASLAATRLIISGPVVPLDPGVELAAYRIVQEALTNARRHAPGAAVDVELRYGTDALRLRVRDNGPGSLGGPGAPADGWEQAVTEPWQAGGHGLHGMRERAFSVGGALYAGAAPGGGFLVEAVLPAEAGDARPPGAAAPDDSVEAGR